MKRTPAASKTAPGYPSVTDIEGDRRGFLRLFGKILAGVVAMGPLARVALAEDKPTPRMKGDIKEPEPPRMMGRIAPPVEPPPPLEPPTGGVPRPPEEPDDAICDPKKDDCDEKDDKDQPRHPGTKRPPDPPVEIRTGGEMPAPTPPTRSK